jgi:hypothetical protein
MSDSSKEITPLWDAVPEALRHFNYLESLPRTAGPLLRTLAGFERLPDREKPVALTFSVFEDFARVWHRFITKALGNKWQVVIGDSSGQMGARKFPGAKVIRVPNFLYHGRKIDLFLRHVIGGQPVFLCDDDRYPLFDPSPYLEKLASKDVAAVSLCPRRWFQFEVGGVRHDPMGSFALLFKSEVFFKEKLTFQSPKGLESKHKVFAEGSKHQCSYNTADYANEQLLLRGYRIETEHHPGIIGFDGSTAPRLLLRRRGQVWVKSALEAAEHYRRGSINGAVMNAMIGGVAFERLYRALFHEEPEVVSGFSSDELMAIVDANPRIDSAERTRLHGYRQQTEETTRRLAEHLGEKIA